MNEKQFRLSIVILLAIAVLAFVVFGYQFSQNGRYRQYDYRGDHVIFGNTMQQPEPQAFDTRTGVSTVVQ